MDGTTAGPDERALLEVLVPAPSRPLRRTPAGTGWRLLGLLAFFLMWELASRVGWLGERTIGAPSTVLRVGWDMVRDGSLPRALGASARRVAWALLFGIPVGVALAVVAGLTRFGDAAVDANMQVLRYVPIIAVQPLLLIWFGIGETTKVVLIAIGVAFPVYVTTASAIRNVDAHHHELGDLLGLTAWQRLRSVTGPAALPGFLVGVRLSASVAWLLLIVAEQTNAREGLGLLMVDAQVFLRSDVIVVVIATYALLGLLCDVAIRALERWLLRWRVGR